MKKTILKLISLFVVITLLIGNISVLALGGPTKITDEKNSVSVEIVSAIEDVLQSIWFEKEWYGFANVDYGELCIGNEIPAYEITDNNIADLRDISYYPILNGDGDILCLAAIVYEGQIPLAYLSCDLVADLNLLLREKQQIALIYDRSGVYCWDGSDSTLLENNSLSMEIEYRDYIADIPETVLEKAVTDSVEATITLETDDADVSLMGYDDETAYVSVSVKRQPSGSSWCWAACMACVVQYEKGNSYSCTGMANIYHASTTQGATMYEIKNRLANDFNLYYSLYNGKVLTNILNSLGRGHPLIGGFVYGQNNGHAVVIRGISFSSKTFSIMDPQGSGTTYTSGQVTNSSGNTGTLKYTHIATGTVLTMHSYLYM